jgi:hypothetical protein
MKKRIVSLLLLITLVLFTMTAASAAKLGSTAGYYYYTDIVTSLWEIPINSINIGGKTLVDAETMSHYGFTVTWHPEQRWLEIVDNGSKYTDELANSGALLDMKNGKPGKIAGNYYFTDIITTLGGDEIESYNIGGRTFISAENMSDYGYNVYWFEDERKLSIDTIREPVGDLVGYWSLCLFPCYEAGDESETDYFYLSAEKDPLETDGFTVTGNGNNALSNVILNRSQRGTVALNFSFYQNAPLKLSSSAYLKLSDVVSFKYGEYIKEPSLVYNELNALIQVYINGERVMITELKYGQGNGHSDYTLVLDNDGSLKKSSVENVSLLFNIPEGMDVPTSSSDQNS